MDGFYIYLSEIKLNNRLKCVYRLKKRTLNSITLNCIRYNSIFDVFIEFIVKFENHIN